MKKRRTSRIYKKMAPNGMITSYLGKRDYVDHISHTDSIGGVVLVDPEIVEDKKVFAKLTCAFRYGREDLDVMGLQFRKDFCNVVVQVYPPLEEHENASKTKVQEQLLKKLGDNAYPFTIEIPNESPCSVSLQPAPEDAGKPCGVDYELRTFVADDDEEEIVKKSAVKFVIRKIQFAPDQKGQPPSANEEKQFLMSDKPLCLKASLDKDLYYHGEEISVTVNVNNTSSKSVKKIKICVEQITNICLFADSQYKCVVATLEADDQIKANSTASNVYTIQPLLSNNKDKYGLALDGKLKQEDTNLASSTILKEGVDKENIGIVVQYQVEVKLILGGIGGGDVVVNLPLQLMHSKPDEE